MHTAQKKEKEFFTVVQFNVSKVQLGEGFLEVSLLLVGKDARSTLVNRLKIQFTI